MVAPATTFKLSDDTAPEGLPRVGTPPVSIQQLWFAIQRLEWSSMVLVPAGPETSALEVGKSLHEVGRLAMGDRLRLIDGRGVKVDGTASLILDMTGDSPVRPAGPQLSERVLVMIDSPLEQPSGVPIALAADAAILCIELGKNTTASARETLQLIGSQRFLGCITLV